MSIGACVTKRMKIFNAAIVFLIFVAAAFAQELPSNFSFKRETGEKSGLPFYTLAVSTESLAYDAGQGNSFEALGALVQPERGSYSLILMNAKPKYEFSENTACTLTVGSEDFGYKKTILAARDRVGKLFVENIGLEIKKDVFFKLVKANDVTIRCGTVTYNLDKDNIDAIRYLGSEIEADLTSRGKSAIDKD